MEDSILISVKKLLGMDEHYDCFDLDIITHINTVFLILNQMGIRDGSVFSIDDETAVWGDFISDEKLLGMVKTYMFRKVQTMFDPPTGAVAEAANRTIDELEWRLHVAGDHTILSPLSNGGEENE